MTSNAPASLEEIRWVLLPGFDGTGKLFTPLRAVLPAGVTPTVVAYPGGRAQSPEELLPVIWEALPREQPFALIAESFSGPLAIRVAAAKPPGIRALVLAASFAHLPWLAGLAPLAKMLGPWIFSVRLPEWAVRRYLLGRDAPAPLVAWFYRALGSLSPETLGSRLAAMLVGDARESLRAVSVPVLYLQATGDRLIGPRHARLIARLCPQARIETLDAPHLILQRQPAEAHRLIIRFLQGCGDTA